MKPHELGHGVIQLHNTSWLTDGDDGQADAVSTQNSPQPSLSTSLSSLSLSSPFNPTPSKPSPPSRRPRAAPHPPPQRLKKPSSYAAQYAAVAPTLPHPPRRAEEEKELLEPEQYSPSIPDPNANILVIAPFTPPHPHLSPAPSAADASLAPCLDESSLALRYPDYFPAQDDVDPSSPSSSASSPSPTSSPTFTPYTLSDFRILPREVRLGSLGSSVDPAEVDAQRRKRRNMKDRERRVREANARQLAATRKAEVEEAPPSPVKALSKRDKALAFAAAIPKPRPQVVEAPTAPAAANFVGAQQGKGGGKESGKGTGGKRGEMKGKSTSGTEVGDSGGEKSLDALLATQEEARQAVQRLRQTMRL